MRTILCVFFLDLHWKMEITVYRQTKMVARSQWFHQVIERWTLSETLIPSKTITFSMSLYIFSFYISHLIFIVNLTFPANTVNSCSQLIWAFVVLPVYHGFWLVSMVFQGSFMVFHGFWLVSMIFKLVSWFLVGFRGFSRWFHGFSWFLVGFHGFSRLFHGFCLVYMVFQGSFMVFGWFP